MIQLKHKRRQGTYILWNLMLVSIVFSIPYTLNLILGWSVSTDDVSEALTYPWLRWDSYHYLSIASAGYKAEVCGDALCGNTGWFPLYPFLVRLLHIASLGATSITTSAIIISFFSFVALCWNISYLTLDRWAPPIVALLLLVMPGGIYLVSGFPISLLLCFVTLAYRAHEKGNTAASALYGLFSGLAYPSAIFFALGFWPLHFSQKVQGAFRRLFVSKLIASASILTGLFVAMQVIDLSSGYSSAYALTQSRYGHSFGFGFEVARSAVRYFWKNPIFSQTLLVLILLAVSTSILLSRRDSLRLSRLLGLYLPGVALYLFALMAGDTVSIYRQEALLSPLFVLCVSLLPRKHLLLLLSPVVLVSFLMFQEFFKGVLV